MIGSSARDGLNTLLDIVREVIDGAKRNRCSDLTDGHVRGRHEQRVISNAAPEPRRGGPNVDSNSRPIRQTAGSGLLVGTIDVTDAFEVQHDHVRRFLGADIGGIDCEIGVRRFLVRIGDSGELLDDSGAGLGV